MGLSSQVSVHIGCSSQRSLPAHHRSLHTHGKEDIDLCCYLANIDLGCNSVHTYIELISMTYF